MTTVPFMPIVEIITRMALTATASAPFLSPRPTQRAAAIAAASVTRTSSRARLRSGDCGATCRLSGSGLPDMAEPSPPEPLGVSARRVVRAVLHRQCPAVLIDPRPERVAQRVGEGAFDRAVGGRGVPEPDRAVD